MPDSEQLMAELMRKVDELLAKQDTSRENSASVQSPGKPSTTPVLTTGLMPSDSPSTKQNRAEPNGSDSNNAKPLTNRTNSGNPVYWADHLQHSPLTGENAHAMILRISDDGGERVF